MKSRLCQVVQKLLPRLRFNGRHFRFPVGDVGRIFFSDGTIEKHDPKKREDTEFVSLEGGGAVGTPCCLRYKNDSAVHGLSPVLAVPIFAACTLRVNWKTQAWIAIARTVVNCDHSSALSIEQCMAVVYICQQIHLSQCQPAG